jgi:hypothetical protein
MEFQAVVTIASVFGLGKVWRCTAGPADALARSKML